MFKTIKTLIAVAALSGTIGANVQAKEVTVHKGDTLWELSEVQNTSVENVKKWNNLATDVIHPDDILNIAAMKHYMVKQSDTLWSVADENNVNVQELIEWNELYTNLIHPGLNLVIYDNSVTPGQMAPIKQAEAKEANPTDLQANTGTAAGQITAGVGDQSTENLTLPAPVSQVTQQAADVKPVNDHADTSSPAPASVPAPAQTPAAPAPAPAPETAPAPAPAPETAPAPVQAPAQAAVQSDASKEIKVKATAYIASCEGCSGITKTGVNLKENPDEKVIAVDPSVIPLGSKVYIEGYGEATAADTGGAIKGNRIDVYMQNESDALQFGAKELTVKILK